MGASTGQNNRNPISMKKFKWRAGFSAAMLMIAHAAFAAGAPVWTIDPTKSKLGFSGSQTGQPFSGNFSRFNAAIALDPAHLDASQIKVTVDLASAATGDTQRDRALPGDDWFDISQFPQATFISENIRQEARRHAMKPTARLHCVAPPIR